MKHRTKSCIAAFVLALASVAAQADNDIARGAKLVYTCLGCHGIENYKNAYPKYSVPKLGGQNAVYLAAALAEYRSGARWHPTMRGYASALSAQERADLAAFLSMAGAKVSSAAPVGTPPDQAATCVACHGNTGVGTMNEYPNLAGQYADYMVQALNDYRLGKRKNAIMQPFAQQLSQDDIKALAKFFAAQKGLATPTLD